MRPSKESLTDISASTGFRSIVLEKAARLLGLLTAIQSHPFLKNRLILKGGTALNLFLLDMPRLSVDIDLNYIGSPDKETMLAERPQVENALGAVFGREELQVRRIPTEHAGGKWRLQYLSVLGGLENLELDLNYMYRIPLWPVETRDSKKLGPYQSEKIPTVDIYELVAGKLTALFSRSASRDLFDAHQLLTKKAWDRDRLRLGFVVFGAMSRKDWRTISIEDIGFDIQELQTALFPTLRSQTITNLQVPQKWASNMVAELKRAVDVVLPFSEPELEFLDTILDHGEIVAELLTSDERIMEKIETHPLLHWKALNVKKFQED